MESAKTTQQSNPLIHKLKEMSVASSESNDFAPLATRQGNDDDRSSTTATSLQKAFKPPVLASSSRLVGGTCSPIGERSPKGSPATSQVSVGSIGHAHVAALLPRHFDLTPIARNTSELPNRASGAKEYNIISPGETADLLALPADLSAPPVGPSIPPLKAQRSVSVGTYSSFDGASLSQNQHVPPPLPMDSRKFYSFTSREQYQEDVKQPQQDAVPLPPRGRPYQPSRQEDLAFAALPADEVNHIFKSDGVASETEKNHRLLQPIPLDDRQWSIPSLHRASQLYGSLASLTDCSLNTEEEDTIVVPEDDEVSWSSTSLEVGPATIIEDFPIIDACFEETSDDSNRAVRRKRTKAESASAAFAWLQSLEAGPTDLAEAASSKFLQASAPMEEQGLAARRQSLPVLQQLKARKKEFSS